MYIYLFAVLIIRLFAKIIDCYIQSSESSILELFLYAFQFAFLLVYCIKGYQLSQKRDEYRKDHQDHYYPDGYIYVVLFWIAISSGVILLTKRFFSELFSEQPNFYGVAGFAFLLLIIIVPVSILLYQTCCKISTYDPVSKIFKHPQEDSKQSAEPMSEKDKQFIEMWGDLTEDQKEAAIAFMRAFKK